MKRIIALFSILIFSGCSISADCVESAGTVEVRQIVATPFQKIMVFPGISLVVKQGSDYQVSIRAGSNFIGDIEAKIENNMLTLRDNSGCNWVRDYGNTVVYVTAPDLVEIYSNTDRAITSDGTLTYPILRLYAMDSFGGVGTGDFHLEVNNEQLVVESNNIAAFYITGQSGQLLLHFYDDLGRFEGADFPVNDIEIFQRSSNDMIVHPLESLSGDIYSTGNVISKTHPPTVNVNQHYTGHLIYDF